MLVNREYQPRMIDSAIQRARNIPRDIALRKVVKTKHTERPVAVVSWDPRLPHIDPIQEKHWRAMTSLDPHLKEVYPEAPLLAYRRPKNIREYLIKAKLPPPGQSRPFRQIKGMQKCKDNCLICPFILETKEVRSKTFVWRIENKVNCKSYNIQGVFFFCPPP